MNENNNYKEISFFDLFNALLKRAKIILCVTLALLLAGGAGGALLAVMANCNYGTQAEFYVYSDKMNNYILPLIQSDSFAEAILLDENGLPADDKDTKAYTEALEAKNSVKEKELEIEAMKERLDDYPLELTRKQKKLSEAQSKYDDIYKLLNMYKSTNLEYMDEEAKAAHIEQIGKFEAALAEARTKKEEAQEAYNLTYDESKDLEKQISDAKKDVEKLQQVADDSSAELLKAFRQDKDNASNIQKIKDSVTYAYADGENNSSQALLYVNIAVEDDEEFARFLLTQICNRLPLFVENDTLSSWSASCEYVSTFNTIEKIEAKNVLSETLKLGVIAAVVGFVGSACIVLIAYAFKNAKKVASVNDAESSSNE